MPLQFKNLNVQYGISGSPDDHITALDNISIKINKGECVSVVGESGSGKSTLALASMKLLAPNAVMAGQVLVGGTDISGLSDSEMETIRWNEIAIVFQNYGDVLNPVHRIIDQIAEPLIKNGESRSTALDRSGRMLDYLKIKEGRDVLYPHQISAGERQRVLMAMALITDPGILVLDEPVASVDAITKSYLAEVINAQVDGGKAVLLITHDLSFVPLCSDRCEVLYFGSILESLPSHELLDAPRHPYTRALVRSFPMMERAKDLAGVRGVPPSMFSRSSGRSSCIFQPRCTQSIGVCSQKEPQPVSRRADGIEGGGGYVVCHRGGIATMISVKDVSKSYNELRVLSDVSLTLDEGEILALVGETGSGKTTLAYTIAGTIEPDGGEILFRGKRVLGIDRKEFAKTVGIVYQSPRDSISHRFTVFEAIAEPLHIHGEFGDESEGRIENALREVQLPADEYFLQKYPHELSGGELQRVAIARALILAPDLLIADESTSFLDPSVQAKVLRLLLDLQNERGISMLFVTHDIGVARKVSDRIAVLHGGRIVENAPAHRVIASPEHSYTKQLIGVAKGGG
uniref:Vitamin B12 import ATP-binding protein BtuD n=1 Tax=Candidatus Methanogaster sp. ANME-2c ERB4 TaxID=2759911 RepID=A0A7G9YLH4_9EURY|nr:vitamin B12 import ATP-binding protein BtuD [Methanosarcinales archaeon ANME-2c ERB4]QNO46067.1 vitamin B12 import ATP-binding protein BtuD [Methanosarcinales archaeon ANME-2c ERB4]QNO48858.1 vitamin B12 import ATP-binding protein BtuD [Methanosarcinales archaeon ANME-2c ERB4]